MSSTAVGEGPALQGHGDEDQHPPAPAGDLTPRRRARKVAAAVVVAAILGAGAVAAIGLVGGTWMVSPVLSGSMRPGLPVGGVVVSERVPVSALAVRDVIVFRRPDLPSEQMVHRVVGLDRGGTGVLRIRTQGDANAVQDPWTLIVSQSYMYRARWSVPLVGYAAVAFQNHRSDVLTGAGLVALLVAISTAVKAKREVLR